jgi:hypothetical protein
MLDREDEKYTTQYNSHALGFGVAISLYPRYVGFGMPLYPSFGWADFDQGTNKLFNININIIDYLLESFWIFLILSYMN